MQAKGKAYTANKRLADWPGIGKEWKGPNSKGELKCLGGCGAILAYMPKNAIWINRNLAWCKECAANFRLWANEDPCFPRIERENQLAALLNLNYEDQVFKDENTSS